MSTIAFDYSGTPVTVTIKNAIDVNCCKYRACDAGTPVQRVVVAYDSIKDKCVKFDYLFTSDGKFMTVKDYNKTVAEDAKIEIKAPVTESSYAVVSYQKFKNTDRKIPAYRTFNGKTLKAGESVVFTTSNKDEVVFYEKLVEIFGATTTDGLTYTGGELDLTIAPAAGE